MRHDDAVETLKRHGDDEEGAAHDGHEYYVRHHLAVPVFVGRHLYALNRR